MLMLLFSKRAMHAKTINQVHYFIYHPAKEILEHDCHISLYTISCNSNELSLPTNCLRLIPRQNAISLQNVIEHFHTLYTQLS